MSIESTVSDLFKQGVKQITIALSPNSVPFIQVQQGVQTGSAGNGQQVVHQIEADSLGECLELAKKQVAHANELKANVVQLARPGNGR
jgi:hypothetical protein